MPARGPVLYPLNPTFRCPDANDDGNSAIRSEISESERGGGREQFVNHTDRFFGLPFGSMVHQRIPVLAGIEPDPVEIIEETCENPPDEQFPEAAKA